MKQLNLNDFKIKEYLGKYLKQHDEKVHGLFEQETASMLTQIKNLTEQNASAVALAKEQIEAIK